MSAQLPQEPYRRFDAATARVHAGLFAAEPDLAQQREVVRDWIRHHQPCLFARQAVQTSRLEIEIVDVRTKLDDPADIGALAGEAIRWWCQDVERNTVGLVIVLAAEHLAWACRSMELRTWCDALMTGIAECPVRGGEAVEFAIEFAVNSQHTATWRAPVNLFLSALADTPLRNRFFPGGGALSLNSVGLYSWKTGSAQLSPEHCCPFPERVSRLLAGTIDLAGPGLVQLDETTFASRYDLDAAVPAEFFESIAAPTRQPPAQRHSIPTGMRLLQSYPAGPWNDCLRQFEVAQFTAPTAAHRPEIPTEGRRQDA